MSNEHKKQTRFFIEFNHHQFNIFHSFIRLNDEEINNKDLIDLFYNDCSVDRIEMAGLAIDISVNWCASNLSKHTYSQINVSV